MYWEFSHQQRHVSPIAYGHCILWKSFEMKLKIEGNVNNYSEIIPHMSWKHYNVCWVGWKYSLKSKRINTQTQNDLFIFAKFIITLLIMYFIYILHGSFVGLDLEARNVSLTPLVTKKITSQKTLYIAIRAPSVSRWTSLNQITRTHLLYFITTISVVPYRFLRFVPVNLKPNDNIFLLCHDGYHFLLTLINRITL